MKKLILLIAMVLGIQLVFSQTTTNPVYRDVSPDQKINKDPQGFSREAWDVVFNYQMPSSDSVVTAGVETDGDYFYTSAWNSIFFAQFDMQGNYIEEFTVQGAGQIRDLAYDGQYFYGGDPSSTNGCIYVMDFENRICIDTIQTETSQIRAIAYDHDLDMFYVNNWSDDIKLIDRNGNIVDSFETGNYESYYGFAYDSWSEDGPFLWGFSQDNGATLVQIKLPEGIETGFALNLNYLSYGGSGLAGGLFTFEGEQRDNIIIGGILQNDALFGLELGPAFSGPDSCFAASYLHGQVIDSTDVALSWSPAKFNILNEGFENMQFPPFGWEATSDPNGWGWHGYLPPDMNFQVPDWDSDFAVTAEYDVFTNGCCDFLVTPSMFFKDDHDYILSFESYYDGTDNQSAYVKYTLDSGLTWQLLETLTPETAWARQYIDLSGIPVVDSTQPVRIAFHGDDNGGPGSGWAVDNILVYEDNIPLNILGYEVYRDGIKMHSGLLTDTTFLDLEVPGGTHYYFVKTVYSNCASSSDNINVFIPYEDPPPPPLPCDPPQNLTADVLDNNDIELNWNSPQFGSSDGRNVDPYSENSPVKKFVQPKAFSRDAWDVQFEYALANPSGEAGAECDGNYFYTSKWNGDHIYRYDLNGNFMDTIVIQGVSSVRDMAYVESTGYTYASNASNQLYILDLYSETLLGVLQLPDAARGLAYDHDQDGFYFNNWATDIMLVDRTSGSLISSFSPGSYGSYYGFAYDSWSDGSPYLWGFSQDGATGGATLVQMQLPSGNETGFIVDVSMLSTSGNGIAGGLFTQPNIIPGTVTIGGVIQNEVLFGLELGDAEFNYFLDGYNVYMDDVIHNSSIIEDTSYLVSDPGAGTYNFEVTAVYVDSMGVILCESEKEGPVEVTIEDNGFILGGNIFANAHKLDAGEVNIYMFDGEEIIENYTAQVNELGYYFLPEMQAGNYMIHASPHQTSQYYSQYVPTYKGGQLHWEDAMTTYISSNSYNNDVNLLEKEVLAGGEGEISGYVFDQDPGRENPLENVLVMLMSTSGATVGLDYTNSSGKFSFSTLPFISYKLLVEITGKSMDPASITLSEAKPVEPNMNMLVGETQIYLGIDDNLPVFVDYVSKLYPNPAEESSNLMICLNESASLSIMVYDPRGQRMNEKDVDLAKGTNTIAIDISNFRNGIYYLSFEFENGSRFVKKLLVNR